jgi:hypothetical protein
MGASASLGQPALRTSAAAKPANVPIPDRVLAAATAVAVKPEATKTPPPPTWTPSPTATPIKPVLTAVPVTPIRSNDTTIDSVAP